MKKEITRERKWQRMTVAVVLLLAVAAQAGAQTVITVTNSGNVYQLTKGQEISFREDDLHRDEYGCIYGWFSDTNENKQTVLTSGKTYKFNGSSGYYGFKKYDDGRGPYIEVIPLKSNSLDRNDQTAANYLTYDINTGDGAIWAMGGANFCFMSARASGVHGWEGASEENIWADNSVALININKKYTLRITTGYQIAGTAGFIFKFFHKPIWETFDNGWKKYYEFRGQRKNDASDDEQTIISFIEKPDFLYISKGNDLNNPSNGEGNITAETIGFDSQLPRMPDGYTFDFVIDLSATKPSGFDYKNVPLSVTLVKQELYEPDKEEIEKGIYRVKLNNGGTKRIWLRDALRFDFDIPYKETNGEEPASITAELPNLIIEGTLNDADMQELSALVKNAKVITLDLTNATWEGMAIPANFANGATLLKEVKLPKVNGIGANAFNGCTGLENINEMLNNVSGSIGNSAFEECTNEKFNTLIIPNTISELGNRAFADDIQLTKVTVPSSYYQEKADRIIPICEKDAFYGINANGCEVEFTGEDDSNNYAEYRKQAGWMYLLTKDLDDMKVYDNVYQSHADAVVSRTFNHLGWYSVAYPFNVNAETLLSVKDENGNAVFCRAATLWSDDFHLKNYPTAYFRYLNNTDDLSDWGTSGKNEEIEAGKPFIVKVANQRSDKKCIFKDVTTYPSKNKKGYSYNINEYI